MFSKLFIDLDENYAKNYLWLCDVKWKKTNQEALNIVDRVILMI